MDNLLLCYTTQATQYTFQHLKKNQRMGQRNGSVSKALATKVNSVPETHITEEKKQLVKVVFWTPHVCHCMVTCAFMHKYTHKYNKCHKLFNQSSKIRQG